MAYDSEIEFPLACSTAQRDGPVLGSFSQITKINRSTLEYWSAALNSVPDSILVIKDKGCYCSVSCRRIEDTLQSMGVDPSRIYFFGPVASQLDHLDSYNAIDIALDTTPWSSATTAYEALGMGVPLVPIFGDTTSGRMSTSVVTAAGLGDLVAHSRQEFARIVAKLSHNYLQIRKDKGAMQGRIRSSILFDEQRICKDFFATIESLVSNHSSLL
jgi:predicted O-linked N-acetylglucosamine transferase (SPINDLY family)